MVRRPPFPADVGAPAGPPSGRPPPGALAAPRVGPGTVQYLLGLCSEELGNRAEADAAFKAAAATESLLTEDGPAVKDLVAARSTGVK